MLQLFRSCLMGDTCLFCLEETTQENVVILVDFTTYAEVPCNCRLYSHVGCWMSYYMSKGGFECPICHSRIVTSPPHQAVTVRIVQVPPEDYRCPRIVRILVCISPLFFFIMLGLIYIYHK